VTLAVAVVYAGLFLQDALSAVSRVDASPKFLLIFLGIASMGALVGTHLLFTAGIDRYGPGRLRRLALALTAFAACAAVGAVTAGAAITRVVPTGWGALAVAELLPGRAEALIRVDGGAYSGAAFWLVGNTTAPRQITRRLTSQANFLPDGTWVVYDTRRGSLGLRRDDCELRRVRTDGSGDRLVIGGQPCDAERFFSRDSTRVALRIVHEAFHPDPRGFVPRTTREALRIIWLDASRAPSELDLSDPTGELRSFTPHGWVLGDRYLLLSGLRTLNLLDVETGAITELFRSPVALDMHGRPVRYEGLGAEIVSPSRAFVATRGVAAFRAGACDSCSRAVIDLSSGELLPLPSCPSGRRGDIVAAAGGERYWVSCSTPPDTWLTSDTSPPAWDAQIGLVNDGAGDVEFVATLPRQWNRGRVLASPDGERLLVTLLQPSRLRDPDRLRRYLVVHRTGRVVELESLADAGAVVPAETTSDRHAVLRNRWEIEGWLSNENIAVSRDAERFTIMRSRSFTEFGYTNASLDSPVVLLRRGEGR
jgi:hypothetical protein